MSSDFYEHPALYDALLPVSAHVAFYVELAREHAGSVLDLACGTGQLTVPVASAGLETVGLDQSAAMLAVARGRASDAGAPVTWVQGDMRDFSLEQAFDFIFVARNSLLHLLTTADLLAAFAAMRRHLTPDGVIAFDIFNPDVRLLARTAGQRFPLMDVTTAAFGRLRVEDMPDYDSATQVNHSTWYVSTPERPDAWILPIVLRSIFPEELLQLLSASGLVLVNRFGDLSRMRFGRGSRMQICICRRA